MLLETRKTGVGLRCFCAHTLKRLALESLRELDRVGGAYLQHSDAFWNSVLGTSHLPEDRRRYLDTLLEAIANEPFFRNDRYQVFARSIPQACGRH
jgi:hypothetical protein